MMAVMSSPETDTSPSGVASVTAVCLVHSLLPEPTNPDGLTAIDKRPVALAVQAGPLGLAADMIKDYRHHGGIEQAVYVYADEDAAWWAAELGREITPGLFGENLRSSGVDVSGAEIGERWLIGDQAHGVLLEVTAPRIPCQTFARRMGEKSWVKRFTEHGACGAYLRVVAGGRVAEGDAVTVVHRPGHGVTIGHVFPDLTPAAARTLLDAAEIGVVDLGPRVARSVRVAAARP